VTADDAERQALLHALVTEHFVLQSTGGIAWATLGSRSHGSLPQVTTPGWPPAQR
jgi:hypothetical protein